MHIQNTNITSKHKLSHSGEAEKTFKRKRDGRRWGVCCVEWKIAEGSRDLAHLPSEPLVRSHSLLNCALDEKWIEKSVMAFDLISIINGIQIKENKWHTKMKLWHIYKANSPQQCVLAVRWHHNIYVFQLRETTKLPNKRKNLGNGCSAR